MKAKDTQKMHTTDTRMSGALRGLFFSLTLSLFSISWPTASYAACGAHDQLCIFHSFGAPVTLELAKLNNNMGVVPTGNNLFIYAIGTDPVTGLPSTVDFDNKVLLPLKTGNKAVVGSASNYTTSTNPFLVSSTAYGAAHPPPDWNTPGDGGAQVYGSQYQVIFNNLTSIARLTGDPGGGEEGNIPNSTSCQNLPAGARNCEAVQVSLNVPSGIYEQKVRIFNFPGVANPKVDIQAGAYVTGNLVLVSSTHGTEQAYFPKLEGTGAISPTYQYEVYNRDFNPHAVGVASYDLSQRSQPYRGKIVDQGDHTRQNIYQDIETTHHKINGRTQWDMMTHSTRTATIGHIDVMKPVVVTSPQSAKNTGYCIGFSCPGVTPISLDNLASANLTPISSIQIPACTGFGCPLIYVPTDNQFFHENKVRSVILNELKNIARDSAHSMKRNWSDGNYFSAINDFGGVLGPSIAGGVVETFTTETIEGQVGAVAAGFGASKVFGTVTAIGLKRPVGAVAESIATTPKLPKDIIPLTHPPQAPIIPQGWVSRPGTKVNGSEIYYPAGTEPSIRGSTYIRVMPENHSPVPGLQNGYWIYVKDGESINILTMKPNGTMGDIHIPLPENTAVPLRR